MNRREPSAFNDARRVSSSSGLRIRHIFRPNSAAIRPILKGWGTK
jgi:hypothetical protein